MTRSDLLYPTSAERLEHLLETSRSLQVQEEALIGQVRAWAGQDEGLTLARYVVHGLPPEVKDWFARDAALKGERERLDARHRDLQNNTEATDLEHRLKEVREQMEQELNLLQPLLPVSRQLIQAREQARTIQTRLNSSQGLGKLWGTLTGKQSALHKELDWVEKQVKRLEQEYQVLQVKQTVTVPASALQEHIGARRQAWSSILSELEGKLSALQHEHATQVAQLASDERRWHEAQTAQQVRWSQFSKEYFLPSTAEHWHQLEDRADEVRSLFETHQALLEAQQDVNGELAEVWAGWPADLQNEGRAREILRLWKEAEKARLSAPAPLLPWGGQISGFTVSPGRVTEAESSPMPARPLYPWGAADESDMVATAPVVQEEYSGDTRVAQSPAANANVEIGQVEPSREPAAPPLAALPAPLGLSVPDDLPVQGAAPVEVQEEAQVMEVSPAESPVRPALPVMLPWSESSSAHEALIREPVVTTSGPAKGPTALQPAVPAPLLPYPWLEEEPAGLPGDEPTFVAEQIASDCSEGSAFTQPVGDDLDDEPEGQELEGRPEDTLTPPPLSAFPPSPQVSEAWISPVSTSGFDLKATLPSFSVLPGRVNLAGEQTDLLDSLTLTTLTEEERTRQVAVKLAVESGRPHQVNFIEDRLAGGHAALKAPRLRRQLEFLSEAEIELVEDLYHWWPEQEHFGATYRMRNGEWHRAGASISRQTCEQLVRQFSSTPSFEEVTLILEALHERLGYGRVAFAHQVQDILDELTGDVDFETWVNWMTSVAPLEDGEDWADEINVQDLMRQRF